jgi:hypothetical protein
MNSILIINIRDHPIENAEYHTRDTNLNWHEDNVFSVCPECGTLSQGMACGGKYDHSFDWLGDYHDMYHVIMNKCGTYILDVPYDAHNPDIDVADVKHFRARSNPRIAKEILEVVRTTKPWLNNHTITLDFFRFPLRCIRGVVPSHVNQRYKSARPRSPTTILRLITETNPVIEGIQEIDSDDEYGGEQECANLMLPLNTFNLLKQPWPTDAIDHGGVEIRLYFADNTSMSLSGD